MASLKYKKKNSRRSRQKEKSRTFRFWPHGQSPEKKKKTRFDDDGRRFSFYFFDVSGIFRKGKENFIKSPRGAKLEFFFFIFFFQKPEIYWLVSINTVRHFSLAAIHWQHLIATAARRFTSLAAPTHFQTHKSTLIFLAATRLPLDRDHYAAPLASPSN